MRILIFHGYLLRGTGSNVYNAELSQALVAAGHEVHLLCQDRAPEQFSFVDAVGDWSDEGIVVHELGDERPPGRGRCTVYRPPIGELLPVYVADRYEGFMAKTFDLLTTAELDHYLDANVRAVSDVARRVRLDCALANHLVMGPCILSRALPDEVPYAVKIHGSALEYTVRPHPRFLPFAEEGIARAATVLVGSDHTATRLFETIVDPALPLRTFLGPPGVDVERFRPRDATESTRHLGHVASRLDDLPRRGFGEEEAAGVERLAKEDLESLGYEHVSASIADIQGGYDTAGIDQQAPAAVRSLIAGEGPVVLYVGKLIVSKGVDLLLAAWPLVLAEFPTARLAITGFGAYREGLELMVSALSAGKLGRLRWIVAGGRALEGGELSELTYVRSLLDDLEMSGESDAYLAAAAGMEESVFWLGRLEHDLLADLTPFVDAQIVPSTFPEAFGMVAAEAAACGVIPICARHSGLAEVSDVLEGVVEPEVAQLLSFARGADSVRRLADSVVGVLSLDAASRARASSALAAVSAERFSWAGVADGVCAAATGEHASLRRP